MGSGGGNQSVAILKADVSVKEAVKLINEAILGLGYSTAMDIQTESDRKGLELGHTYLKDPTPTTLRPRIITQEQLKYLSGYSSNLWIDLLELEKIWWKGGLDRFIEMGEAEAELARMQPWKGSPALVASDCLFSFGADIQED